MIRRAVLIAVLALAAVPVAWMVARDAPFLRVQDVRVSGLSGEDAPRIRRALERAAREMTTLAVDEAALRDAVAPFPTVRALEVERDLPRALRIGVRERGPVAAVGGVAVAGDGRVLRGVPIAGLPRVADAPPPPGPAVRDHATAALVTVLAAAPAALRGRVVRVRRSDRGAAVDLRDGPVLFFGDHRRARAKWLAATAVLGHPRAAGAGYVDLRLPERPAAGAPQPSTPTSAF